MSPSVLFDIFKKKFQELTDKDFVVSYKQDNKNPHGIYLVTKLGKLYFHYDSSSDSWFLTNDVLMKSNVLNYSKLKAKIDSGKHSLTKSTSS